MESGKSFINRETSPSMRDLLIADISKKLDIAPARSLVYGSFSGTIKKTPTEYFKKEFDTTKESCLEVIEELLNTIDSEGYEIENLSRTLFIADPSEAGKDPMERNATGGTQTL